MRIASILAAVLSVQASRVRVDQIIEADLLSAHQVTARSMAKNDSVVQSDSMAIISFHGMVGRQGCEHRQLAEGITIAGYTVGDCLGSGFDGEAYVVTEGVARRVMKIAHHGDISERECGFARHMSASEHGQAHFINCLEFGEFTFGNESRKHFMVMEEAPGTELFKLLQDYPEAPPHPLSSLEKVLKVLTQLRKIVHVMVSEGHYYDDLHAGNMFITDDGHITVIDYGRTCASSKEEPCGNVARRVVNMEAFVWFDFLSMLVKPNGRDGVDSVPEKSALLIGQVFRGSRAEGDPAKLAAEAALEIQEHMREAYKKKLSTNSAVELMNQMLIAGFNAFLHPNVEQPAEMIEPVRKFYALLKELLKQQA